MDLFAKMVLDASFDETDRFDAGTDLRNGFEADLPDMLERGGRGRSLVVIENGQINSLSNPVSSTNMKNLGQIY